MYPRDAVPWQFTLFSLFPRESISPFYLSDVVDASDSYRDFVESELCCVVRSYIWQVCTQLMRRNLSGCMIERIKRPHVFCKECDRFQWRTEEFFRGVGWGRWLHQEFFSGVGVQQIQLRIEGRENGDLGAVAP
jgi:hypothetical protein